MSKRFKRAEVFWDEFVRLARERYDPHHVTEPHQSTLHALVVLRPDLEFGGDDSASHNSVIQYFWGNSPGWDTDLLAYNSILDAIADFMKSARPAAILVDNQGSASTVMIFMKPFEQNGNFWKRTSECIILVNTGHGFLIRDGRLELDGEMCLQVDTGYINPPLFATLVKWRWADARVYSNEFRGDEGIVHEEPLPFEL